MEKAYRKGTTGETLFVEGQDDLEFPILVQESMRQANRILEDPANASLVIAVERRIDDMDANDPVETERKIAGQIADTHIDILSHIDEPKEREALVIALKMAIVEKREQEN